MGNVKVIRKGFENEESSFITFDDFLRFVKEQGGEVMVSHHHLQTTITIKEELTYEKLREIVHG